MEANEGLDLDTDSPQHMQTLLAVVGGKVLFEVIKVTGIEGEMQAE